MKTLTFIFLLLISMIPIQSFADEVELSQDEVRRTFRFDAEESQTGEECIPQRYYEKEDRYNQLNNNFRCYE